jgi:hypothetical protein
MEHHPQLVKDFGFNNRIWEMVSCDYKPYLGSIQPKVVRFSAPRKWVRVVG